MNSFVARLRGFTLISTLFLLVVVSGLAAYLVNLSVAQHAGNALSVNALRGRHAALSGLEWMAYHLANVSDTCPSPSPTLSIEGFDVSIAQCAFSTVTEGGASYRLFDVTVQAERGAFGDADYVRLAIRATLRG